MTGVKKLVVVVAGALLCVAAASSIGSAQRGVSGTWRSETPSWWTGGWTVVLEARGTTLTGAVTNCPRPGAVEIFDGRVDGDTIRFSCRSEDGRSTISFAGKLSGDRITFSWDLHLTPKNAGDLDLAWLWPSQSTGQFEATPLVVDGVLYTVQAPNDVVALDAISGEVIWTLRPRPSDRRAPAWEAVHRAQLVCWIRRTRPADDFAAAEGGLAPDEPRSDQLAAHVVQPHDGFVLRHGARTARPGSRPGSRRRAGTRSEDGRPALGVRRE